MLVVLFYLSPRLSDVSTLECCGMWYNGQCLGPDGSPIGYWVNTTHTITTQMKTSRQKRPRMCQLGFLFPTKIWFYVNWSGWEGYTICGMRLGGDQLADRAGCDHVLESWPQTWRQCPVPARLAATCWFTTTSSRSAGARQRPAYSPSEGLGCLFLSNKILSRVPWVLR